MLNKDNVIKAWLEVFPNSSIYPSKACFGDSFFYRAILAKDKSECSGGYFENDPLSYLFEIDGDNYRELRHSFVIKPSNNIYAYDRIRLRKKNIKNITIEKLGNRFKQFKEKITENKNNFIHLEFNINNKI